MNWTLLDSQSNQTWSTGGKRLYEFTNLKPYQTYKFTISESSGTDTWAGVTELAFYNTMTDFPPFAENANATNMMPSSAWISGSLISTGTAESAVTAYWGNSDGGHDAGSWASSNTWVAPQALGGLSFEATGLTTNTMYFFRFAATNDVGQTWADQTAAFITDKIALEAISNGDEETYTPAVFRVVRNENLIHADLTIYYEQTGGTAEEDLDFEKPLGFVTIPAGDTSATIEVTPLRNFGKTTDTTITLSILPINCLASLAGVATASFENFEPATDKNAWIAPSDGYASDASNWLRGVPQAGDDILLNDLSTANMIWDAGVNGLTDTVASWTQTADYIGTITFPVEYDTVSGAVFTNFTITGNALIDGGAWTHAANVSEQTYRLKATIGGTLTVASDTSITADGKGYSSGGIDHGCHGGNANRTIEKTYGNPKYPTEIGARIEGSAGGGAILLNVTSSVILDGAITANGVSASDTTGGAGGSVLINTPSITGSGRISVNGAMGTKHDWWGKAGSGGRIALLTDGALTFPTNKVTAFGRVTGYAVSGGTSGTHGGTGAGTIFLKRAGETDGTLIINNSHAGQTLGAKKFTIFETTSVTPINADETWTFDRVLTSGYGVLSIPEGTTLVLPDGLTSVSSLDTTTPVMNGLRYEGGTLDIGSATTHVISDGWCFQAATPYTFNGNLEVIDGASVGFCRLRQDPRYGFANYVGCTLTVTGDMLVDSTSFIEARYGGYWDTNAEFPTWTHGGVSGYSSASAHDSILSPFRPAGGKEDNTEFYPGGGVVTLTVGGNLQLDGQARADGFRSSGKVDLNIASPGGTLNFTLGSLTGTGSISANGGINNTRMGAGGGRIAIRLTDPSATFDAWRSKITASGRTVTKDSYTKSGSAGTIYLETAAKKEGAGLIIVKNDNDPNSMVYTPIPATGDGADSLASLKEASLALEHCGRVSLTANLRLATLGIETDASIDLAGYTLTLTSMENAENVVNPGTYAATDFLEGVTDSSPESTGLINILGQASLLLLR